MVALTHSPVPPEPLRDGHPSTADLATHLVGLATTLASTPHGGLLLPTTQEASELRVGSTSLASVALGVADGPTADDVPDGLLVVRDTAVDDRWPAWSTTLLGLGVRSVLLATLTTTHGPPGVVVAQATATDAFTDAQAGRFRELALLASTALSVAVDRDGLQRAVAARRLIGIGIGMLTERYDLSVDRAFGVLVRHSQHLNLKLRDVARHLVEHGELPGGRTPPGDEDGRPG